MAPTQSRVSSNLLNKKLYIMIPVPFQSFWQFQASLKLPSGLKLHGFGHYFKTNLLICYKVDAQMCKIGVCNVKG